MGWLQFVGWRTREERAAQKESSRHQTWSTWIIQQSPYATRVRVDYLKPEEEPPKMSGNHKDKKHEPPDQYVS